VGDAWIQSTHSIHNDNRTVQTHAPSSLVACVGESQAQPTPLIHSHPYTHTYIYTYTANLVLTDSFTLLGLGLGEVGSSHAYRPTHTYTHTHYPYTHAHKTQQQQSTANLVLTDSPSFVWGLESSRSKSSPRSIFFSATIADCPGTERETQREGGCVCVCVL
jgi:hypothetical protein